MRFLITGANGFIGRLLCAELFRREQAVRAAVRFGNTSVDDVETTAVGQIDGGTDWTDALRGVEVVIHLAARVHVMKDTAANPLAEFLKVNRDGTANLARQAARAGVKRLVYVSSVKVNGEDTNGGRFFTESDRPDPQDFYGVAKWQAEQVLHQIAEETGLEVVVVRPPLVYGPGVKGNFINLLATIDRGVPLPLAGANNARSLIYVGNMVDALIVCARHPAAAGQAYLVCDGEDISTATLIKKIAQALGRSCCLFYFPLMLLRVVTVLVGRSAQIDRLLGSLQVSDEKIRRELGWSSPYTLEQGLCETADWYQGKRRL
jgi:nucleoside-diphosphate-sugar epimerase